MHKLSCPACNELAFSANQKIWLGPARTIGCSKCGARVSVAWVKSALVLALSTIAFWAGAVLGMKVALYFSTPASPLLFLSSALLGGILLSIPLLFVYVRYVPLVARRP
jgi:hypothetical protein